jgi:outer membrane protein insertion porin family
VVFLAILGILCQVLSDTKVDIVRFAGNKSFSRRVLLNLVQVKPGTPAVNGLLDEDARLLENFYRNEGFFDAQVEKGLGVVAGKVVVTFYIQEGFRAKVADVVVQGNNAFPIDGCDKH